MTSSDCKSADDSEYECNEDHRPGPSARSGFAQTFLCEWDSRDKANHWIKPHWPVRILRTPGHKNISKCALVDPSQVILPPPHIKMGLMKQYVKALDKQGACFLRIANKFPKLSSEKVKESIFAGAQFRALINDEQFQLTMTDVEKSAWLSFEK